MNEHIKLFSIKKPKTQVRYYFRLGNLYKFTGLKNLVCNNSIKLIKLTESF